MGKISYRPKKHQGKENSKVEFKESYDLDKQYEEEGTDELVNDLEADVYESSTEKASGITIGDAVKDGDSHLNKCNHRVLDNVKVIGDMECDYHIYLEDYVYTYIYQYAHSDLSRESAAFLTGEIYADSKEIIIRGVLPVKENEVTGENEWIDNNILDRIERERQAYFPKQDIIGWLHMQPGYGTMLTIKELREHQEVFAGEGTICLLVDAINKIETFFVYDEDELKEQSGYCMYYERNEEMQRYMLDHPFKMDEQEEIKDNVVNQFREIGKIRKEEYMQRKQVNVAVMAASIILIALTAVIVRMNGETSKKGNIDARTAFNNSQTVNENQASDEVDLIIKPAEEVENKAEKLENKIQTKTDEAIDKKEAVTYKEDTDSTEKPKEKVSIVEEEAKANDSEKEYDTYVVKSGDTLADISYRKYGEAKKSIDIAKLNGLDSTDCIYVGQELKLPIY